MVDWKSLPWALCNNVEISKYTGQSVSTVRNHRPKHIPNPGHWAWAERNKDMFGVLPDKEVAEIVHRSERQVWEARKRYNVPSSDPRTQIDRVEFKDEWVPLLGTKHDRTLATQLGCSSWQIWNERRKRNIKPFYMMKQAAPVEDLKARRLKLIAKKCKPSRPRGRPPKVTPLAEPVKRTIDIDEYLDTETNEFDVQNWMRPRR